MGKPISHSQISKRKAEGLQCRVTEQFLTDWERDVMNGPKRVQV